jgi:hypothetical protein
MSATAFAVALEQLVGHSLRALLPYAGQAAQRADQLVER